MKVLIAAFVLYFIHDVSAVARILGVFPHIGKSHYIMFEAVMKALAERGHEVTVISHFPLKDPPSNFKNIDLNGTITTPYVNAVPINNLPGELLNVLCTYELSKMGIEACAITLGSKPVQDLLNSNQKFDLVFYEIFNAECFLGFIHRFNTLSIALSSSAFMPWASDRTGLPDNPSYIANHFSGFSDKMNFWERLVNTLLYVSSNLWYNFLVENKNYEIAQRYFGVDLPPLANIAKNTSLVFVNTHSTLNSVRPYVPNVIEVGGIHIGSPAKLSKELKNFLDAAKEGVVYFSLGSTARGATLPPEKRDAFVEAFRDLPQRVLWKWEEDSILNKPNNVMISKWVPQTAVLAHPNVKVFMTHGGLMGTLEAVHYGVPMIAIPLFGDQFQNVAMIVKRGIGIKLSFSEISVETVKTALNSVLTNGSYQESAKRVSRAFHDRPQKPLDALVYWTEYVLRHNGAPHLQSRAVHLPLYQYLLLDVLAVLSMIFVSILLAIILVIRCICCKGKTVPRKKTQSKQKCS